MTTLKSSTYNHVSKCSCLENPRDGGAWWAAVYGVAQSRTWLERLSSSSSIDKEKEMATHSSILAWRILWTEEPGGLLLMGSHRVRHYWSELACIHALEKEMATHSSILAWRIPGTEEPGELPSMGSHRVGHDWSDLAAARLDMLFPHREEEGWEHTPPPSCQFQMWACILSLFSRVQLFSTLWTIACPALLSMGFSKQEYWSGLPCLPPGYPWPRDRTRVSCSSYIAGRFFTMEPPAKPRSDTWM